jgi:hypothetical protein
MIEKILFGTVRKYSAIPFSNILNAVSLLDKEFTSFFVYCMINSHFVVIATAAAAEVIIVTIFMVIIV